MKLIPKIFKHILTCAVAVTLVSLAQGAAVQAQPAADTGGGGPGCTGSFLGFPAWYNGLATGSDCDIVSPTEVGGIGPFIWKIVLNLVEILLRLAGWAAVAYIIYGGFKYMTSTGSPDGMVSARKTILNAIIGLVISVMAIAIIRLVTGRLGVD